METINILCAADDVYIPYCGIMLTSLFENNRNEKIEVFLLTESINECNAEKINNLSNAYNVKINTIVVNDEKLRSCPVRIGDHVSIAAYYRLLAPLFLPDEIDKILYFDCDVIINGALRELYHTDITDVAIAAVIDESYKREDNFIRLNYEEQYLYVNSGVLLMNLKYWRDNNVVNRCFDYIKNNKEKVLLHDQDTINAVLYSEKKFLPLTYNFQTGFILTHYYFEASIMDEILITVKSNPIVIHYDGVSKPWHKSSKHPYKDIFIDFKNKSLWKNMPMTETRSLRQRIIDFRNNILWTLGIKDRPESYIINRNVHAQ